MQPTPLPIRLSLLTAVALTLGMIVARVLAYSTLVSLPGAVNMIAEAFVLLIAYAVVIAWPQGRISPSSRPQFATLLGAIAGVLQLIHLLVERFCSLSSKWDGRLTLVFMLATFLVWGCAGYRARALGLPFASACLAALWSAMVTMTIAVLAGTAIELFIAPIPPDAMRTWAEFQRSGWNDLAAFSIANTIDEVSTHLLIGPAVSCFVGPLGFAVYRLIGGSPLRRDSEN